MAAIKLFSLAVDPPEAIYCAGGWAVVRAQDACEAVQMLRAAAPDHRVDEASVCELPEGLGVLFLETYQE